MNPVRLLRKTTPLLQKTLSPTTRLPLRRSPQTPLSTFTHPTRPHPRPHPNPFLRQNPHPYSTLPPTPPPQPPLSLSARLRKLSREYGSSAIGIYLALSALDFPFCFAAVRYLGTDRIGRWEHAITGYIKGVIPEAVKEGWRGVQERVRENVRVEEGGDGETMVVLRGGEGGGGGEESTGDLHGVREAEVANEGVNASIWTQLAFAYAIHKSFMFIRVPLTVAVTPKVVKVLRGWGWDIGKRRPKGVKAVRDS